VKYFKYELQSENVAVQPILIARDYTGSYSHMVRNVCVCYFCFWKMYTFIYRYA